MIHFGKGAVMFSIAIAIPIGTAAATPRKIVNILLFPTSNESFYGEPSKSYHRQEDECDESNENEKSTRTEPGTQIANNHVDTSICLFFVLLRTNDKFFLN